MEKNVFETEYFSITSGKYVKTILLMMLFDYWWAILLLLLSCALLAALVNLAFVYVGLIILFILFPSALMFIYFYFSTTEEARIAVLSKKVKLEDDIIVVQFEPIMPVSYEEDENAKPICPKSVFIKKEDIKKIDDMGAFIRIYLKGGKYKFLTIPFSVVKGDLTLFLAQVLQYSN